MTSDNDVGDVVVDVAGRDDEIEHSKFVNILSKFINDLPSH